MSGRAKKWTSGQLAAEFSKAVRQREAEAAREATAVSRSVFTSKLSARPLVGPRMGRPTTGGNFAQDIEWKPAGNGTVEVNVRKLPRYWLINEIGTGQSANIANPQMSVIVPTQVGRFIRNSLVFANGGVAFAPSAARRGMDQLMYATDVSLNGVRPRRIRIRKEIKGKHYLRDGGAQGFGMFQKKIMSDARRIFQ